MSDADVIHAADVRGTTAPAHRRNPGEWLVAIDLDGTTIDASGRASAAVKAQLRRVERAGHHLLVATGRSAATTLSVLDHIEAWPEYVVCSNGGMVLQRDPGEASGYRRLRVAGFEAAPVLHAVRRHLPDALVAVEDERGAYRFTHPFPSETTVPDVEQAIVPFETLVEGRAVRVVAIAPTAEIDGFRRTVEQMDLRGVTFSLGWTAWLDIAAEGITKATAAEELREVLGFSRDRVMAVGDGFNDIELLTWASAHGRGVAMGHAPEELIATASEVTGTIDEDGLAQVLATL